MRHIAEAKRKENIIEFILFMWQVEDLIRSCEFNKDELAAMVDTGSESAEVQQHNTEWILRLAEEMLAQNVREKGHHSSTTEVILELLFVQNSLMTVRNDATFKRLYQKAQPLLAEFKAKSGNTSQNDVETALTALYAIVLLRLKKQEVSPETTSAVTVFTEYLRYLATTYRDMYAGSGQFPMN